MRGLVAGMVDGGMGFATALIGGVVAGLVAAASAWILGCVVSPGVVATTAVRVPVLDGVPLLDMDQVLAEVRAEVEAGHPIDERVSVRKGERWNRVVVEVRARDEESARRGAERAVSAAREREKAMLADALAQADNLETVLLERFDDAQRSGDRSARAEAEVAVASFRLKRDGLLKWSQGLVDPVEIRAPVAGPRRAFVAAALVGFLTLGWTGRVNERERAVGRGEHHGH